MSACYTIELNMKFNSPESMSDAVRSLQEYIKKDAETDYDLESYAADGIGTENIDDLMKIFLSDRKRQRITITDSGEWKNYSADFNASYGWESVLIKMFKILGVYLANGSQLDMQLYLKWIRERPSEQMTSKSLKEPQHRIQRNLRW